VADRIKTVEFAITARALALLAHNSRRTGSTFCKNTFFEAGQPGLMLVNTFSNNLLWFGGGTTLARAL
jgi:hypothetical protein